MEGQQEDNSLSVFKEIDHFIWGYVRRQQNHGLLIYDIITLIINYFGNLPAYFKLASSVFVGKSLIKKLKEVGGQNPIEAAKLGCKIYHGPYIYNFFEIYKILNQNHVSKKVESSHELANFLKSDFTSENNEKLSSFMDSIGKKTLDSNMKVINKFLFHENI